jgi:hypothetical protein
VEFEDQRTPGISIQLFSGESQHPRPGIIRVNILTCVDMVCSCTVQIGKQPGPLVGASESNHIDWLL